MKNKTFKIIKVKHLIFSLIIVAIGYYLLIQWIKNFLLLWNVNNLHVNVEEPLKINKIKVEYGFYSMNRKSDLEIFSNQLSKTIFSNAKIKNIIPNEYGENDFLITYDNKFTICLDILS